MDTLSLSRELAAALEQVDTATWRDVAAAAPDSFRAEHGIVWTETDTHVQVSARDLRWSLINRVLELGLREPPKETEIGTILDEMKTLNDGPFFLIHTVPQVAPPGLPAWLETRRMAVRTVWDRITLDKAPEATELPRKKGMREELVSGPLVHTWVQFMTRLFGLPIDPLLRELAARPGWHHVLMRRQGLTICARSMFITPEKVAWLGLETPIPGVTAPSFDEDARLVQTLLNVAAEQGVTSVVADIPAAHPQQRTPAYEPFAAMGFKHCYPRRGYMLTVNP